MTGPDPSGDDPGALSAVLRHRTVLPTLRFGAARTALSGEGGSTVGQAQREAGVREQL